jgi:hypothetical protein
MISVVVPWALMKGEENKWWISLIRWNFLLRLRRLFFSGCGLGLNPVASCYE